MSDETITCTITPTGDRETDALLGSARILDQLDADEAERVATYLATRYTAMRRAQEPF